MSRLRSAAYALSVLACASCGLIAGLERVKLVDGDAGAASDAGSDAGPVVIDPCDPQVPGPPVGDDNGEDAPRITFAVQYVKASTRSSVPPDSSRLCRDGGASPSSVIDIDRVTTTCDPADGKVVSPSCKPRGRAGAANACDLAGGGDDSASAIAGLYTSTSTVNEEDDPNPALRDGRSGLLLDLAGYDLSDDDGKIAVALVYAVGVNGSDGGPSAPSPKWDGSDEWLGDKRSLDSDGNPLTRAAQAYVRGGMLVARFFDAPFNVGGSGSRLNAKEIVITGRIVRDAKGDVVALDQGRLSVRIALSTLLDYAGGRVVNSISLCAPALRPSLLATGCGQADLLADGGNDPEAPCDAVSLASGFYATRALRQAKPSPLDIDGGAPRACEFPPWPVGCEEVGL